MAPKAYPHLFTLVPTISIFFASLLREEHMRELGVGIIILNVPLCSDEERERGSDRSRG